MSFKQRIVGAIFGGIIEKEVKKRLKAASVSDLEKEEAGWRALTTNSNRDLSPLKQDRMFQIAFWLWENNPLANWIIEIVKDFILAEGLPYEAKNEEVKAVLDGFWKDPVNRLDLFIEKYVRELGIYGELCFPVFVAEQTGKVRLGYIDPAQIEKAVTDPENVKMVIGVILKGEDGKEGRKLKTILPEGAEDVISPRAQGLRETYRDGECFFFAINNVTNSPRGRSDLLTIADWLDAYEQFLFDYADKWPLLNSFVWDLTVENGTPETIKEHTKNFTKKSGSVFGHNEKVKLGASTPDLKSVEASEGARLFRNHILGAKGLPEHWYGGGGDVNRATAVEMGSPAFKMLSSRQKYVKYILEAILGFAIEKARAAEYLKVTDEDAAAFSVTTPELASKDVSKYSATLQQVTASLTMAENQGWVDKDTARKIFALVVGFLGIELNVDEVKKAAEEEADKKEYEDYGDGKDK